MEAESSTTGDCVQPDSGEGLLLLGVAEKLKGEPAERPQDLSEPGNHIQATAKPLVVLPAQTAYGTMCQWQVEVRQG